MNFCLTITGLCGVLLLAACTSIPTGPSTMALPGSGKNFDQFRVDDASCRDYALAQVGGTSTNQTANNAGLKSAAAGAVVGAAAGAAMGGHEGAGAGAGVGLLMGSIMGVDTARQSAYGTQQQYDNAYTQCMYAKGERVAVPAQFISDGMPRQRSAHTQPSAPAYYPPPPGEMPR